MNKIDHQSLANQSNSIKTLFELGELCHLGWFNKGLIFCLLCLPLQLVAQNCDYLPGDIALNSSQAINPTFYTTAYLLINPIQDSILQVNTQPIFLDLKKGIYKAYAITYKTRDTMLNLESGKLLEDITSNCFHLSLPFTFSVCAQPQLYNLEESIPEVCADGNTQIEITDSLNFKDADGLLDTFSIFISIIESPDSLNDVIDVDLSSFIGLTKSFSNSRLEIKNIRSPLQVKAILRAIYFYSTSKIAGNRKIAFQIGDGINLSNSPNREINVSILPPQPTKIFRKKKG